MLSGATGFINADVIKKYVAPATQGRTIVFVCGMSRLSPSSNLNDS
jgi:hypothetical protein